MDDDDLNNGFAMIEDAKNFEKIGNLLLAKDLYMEGIEIFMKCARNETNIKKKNIITKNIKEFIIKAEELKKIIDKDGGNNMDFDSIMPSAPILDDNNDDSNNNDDNDIKMDLPDPPTNEGDSIIDDISDAQERLDEAIEFDQNKEYKTAIKMYTEASQMFIDAIKNNNISKQSKQKSREKVNIILGRIEILKNIINKNNSNDNSGPQIERKSSENTGLDGEGLTSKEIEILKNSSKIRNIVLYPWMVCYNIYY